MQPENYLVDENNQYYCPLCIEGSTWKNGECIECGLAIDKCELCDFVGNCLRCEMGMIPSFDKLTCIPPITDCEDIVPDEYEVVDGEYVCSSCSTGLFWDKEAKKCTGVCGDEITGCIECDRPDEC